ncbi:histidine kinase [Bacteriovorax sp. Seq25_V]|uniref:histidine kinase n=1 Tax=Bacteriovorax sp. Seq25_V TaxID=1201288 RepID=UPI00038A3BC3|nr:histidine kinase [Bacteriovorax sp. Seq25_V]EQC46529.1 histidine kinase A domain protein [Bacteriovorax sp. Seq25_V]
METFLKNKSSIEIINTLDTYFQQESSDILNAVSHDVKNPLGIIELSLGLLEDRIEPLLENIEEAQAAKIKNFFKNISIGIERSQEILENTMLIRSNSLSDEKKEMKIHNFFESFSIYAKPSFKRAKISTENCLDLDLIKNFNIRSHALLLIHFLKFISESIESETHMTLKASFADDSFIFTAVSVSDAEVRLKKIENNDQFSLLCEKLDSLATKLISHYSIENTSAKEVTAKLSWPKA